MADFGVQAWDASGVKTLEITDRNATGFGSITVISTSAGSQNVPALANGTPWFMVIQSTDDYYDRRTVSLAGTTISWGSGSYGMIIYYGWR